MSNRPFSSFVLLFALAAGGCSPGTQEPQNDSPSTADPAASLDGGAGNTTDDAGIATPTRQDGGAATTHSDGGTSTTDAGPSSTATTDAGTTPGETNDAGTSPAVDAGTNATNSTLGQNCTVAGDCDSNICRDGVCSQCQTQQDCAGNQECVASFDLGYFACADIVLAQLGDACGGNGDCASDQCKNDVCSECRNDNDCVGAQTCQDQTGTTGYFVCQGGDVALGNSCAENAACASGICNNSVCSECEFDPQCTGLATCQASFELGYFVCVAPPPAPLGDPCVVDSDCADGFCMDRVGPRNPVCAQCLEDNQCLTDQQCRFSFGTGYNLCEGSAALGDACNADASCRSGFCNNHLCSECNAASDCDGGGLCVDDVIDSGHFICAGGLGDRCTVAGDCGSGFCFDNFNGGVCSQCAIDDDCTNQTCGYAFFDGFAVCR